MKKVMFIIGISLLIFDLYSQNIVVLTKGDTMNVKITQINQDGIKYSYKLQDQLFKGQKTAKELHSLSLENGTFLLFEDYVNKMQANRTEEYCELLATSKLFSLKVTISIDFGQETSVWTKYKDQAVFNELTGKLKSFNSVIDALNWMNSSGWEFVNAYAITHGNQNVYHYLMKRDLRNGKQ